jgi:hypothetical protein
MVFSVAAYLRMLAMAFKPSRCTKWQDNTMPIFQFARWDGEKYGT